MAASRTATVVMGLLMLLMAAQTQAHGQLNEKHKWARALGRMLVAPDPNVKLDVDSTKYTRVGQPFVVSISGVKTPSKDDTLGVWVPGDVDPTKKVAAFYVNITDAAPTYLTSGSAKLTVRLIHMRYSISFKLVTNGILTPTVVATAPLIENAIPNQPTSGHLALHKDERSMVVQWISATSKPQMVKWGTSKEPASLVKAVMSTTHTYTADQMCGFPATSVGFMNPGYMHVAVIPGEQLQAGQRYYYKFGADGDGWSNVFSFLGPYGPGIKGNGHDNGDNNQGDNNNQGNSNNHPTKPFKFLIFNDVANTWPNYFVFNTALAEAGKGGQDIGFAFGQNSARLANILGGGYNLDLPLGVLNPTDIRTSTPEEDANLALLVGDLSYAEGYVPDWDAFGQQFEAAFTRWPLMVGTGNHERDWPGTDDAYNGTSRDSGGECNVAYMNRFYTPANIKGNPRLSYYSFNQGPVHFLVLDSETVGSPDSPQGQFAAQDLARVDRSKTPWVVVGTHRMMLAPATFSRAWTGDLQVEERQLADFEDLFLKYKVDIVFSGHQHAYARTCPVAHLTCQQGTQKSVQAQTGSDDTFKQGNGIVYIMAGHGGASFTNGFPVPLPDWVRSGFQTVNGYVRFTVTASSMRMESINAADGSVIDAMTLNR